MGRRSVFSVALSSVVAGAIALVLGWCGVADETLTAQQLPYLVSGGIGGLFLLGLGATLLLSADLRDDWRKLDRIEEELALGRVSRRPDARDEAVALHAVRVGNG